MILDSPLVANSVFFRYLKGVFEDIRWMKNDYGPPSPHHIKRKVLLRNGVPNGTWIETGTYLGQTTKWLADNGNLVYSIEPEPTLYSKARSYFDAYGNVKILNGLSETVMSELLPTLSGDVNFFLDGHYSAGQTFKGPQDTPILDELDLIESNISRFNTLCVMIDDIRCFNPDIPQYSSYPSLDKVVDWAKSLNLLWHIEHDIFIAKSRV